MHISKYANAPEPPGHGLVYGLNPLRVAHARLILIDGANHSPARRIVAWRTLKEARGETIDPMKLREAIGLRPVEGMVQ